MKFTAKLVLILLFIPLFLVGILAISVKFQVLQPDFWQTTFRANDVYTKLAVALKNTAETQTVKEGGSLQEARVLTNLITSSNLQDFIEKNLENILDFANGKVKEAIVYIPINKLPGGLLPKNLGKISENMPLATLLAEFNVHGIQKAQIDSLSQVGLWSTRFLIADLVLIGLILAGLIFLVDEGNRFVAPGIAFLISGLLILAVSLFVWVKGSEPSQVLLSTFAPYVLGKILRLWMWAGVTAVILGLILLFVKKPSRSVQT